jgi:two-component system chemotaxis response regulator CheB
VVPALRELAAGLSAPLAAPVLAVLHLGPQGSELSAILSAAGPMPAKHGKKGRRSRQAASIGAPADRHGMAFQIPFRPLQEPWLL